MLHSLTWQCYAVLRCATRKKFKTNPFCFKPLSKTFGENPMMYLTNAFSVNMLPSSSITSFGDFQINFREVSLEVAKNILTEEEWISAVGHQSTADLLSVLFGIEIIPNRISVEMRRKSLDFLLMAQYSGPRLQEGVTELPEGAKIRFWIVDLKR